VSYPIDAQKVGESEKYGSVYVERTGATGPMWEDGDRARPATVFHADDRFAVSALEHYHRVLQAAHDLSRSVDQRQLDAVASQIERFKAWQEAHPERLRYPGSQIQEKNVGR
jgi:hypothetical protein